MQTLREDHLGNFTSIAMLSGGTDNENCVVSVRNIKNCVEIELHIYNVFINELLHEIDLIKSACDILCLHMGSFAVKIAVCHTVYTIKIGVKNFICSCLILDNIRLYTAHVSHCLNPLSWYLVNMSIFASFSPDITWRWRDPGLVDGDWSIEGLHASGLTGG